MDCDFREVLVEIARELSLNDLAGMRFLCEEFLPDETSIPQRPNVFFEALKFFRELKTAGKRKRVFVQQLLEKVKRADLASKLDKFQDEAEHPNVSKPIQATENVKEIDDNSKGACSSDDENAAVKKRKKKAEKRKKYKAKKKAMQIERSTEEQEPTSTTEEWTIEDVQISNFNSDLPRHEKKEHHKEIPLSHPSCPIVPVPIPQYEQDNKNVSIKAPSTVSGTLGNHGHSKEGRSAEHFSDESDGKNIGLKPIIAEKKGSATPQARCTETFSDSSCVPKSSKETIGEFPIEIKNVPDQGMKASKIVSSPINTNYKPSEGSKINGSNKELSKEETVKSSKSGTLKENEYELKRQEAKSSKMVVDSASTDELSSEPIKDSIEDALHSLDVLTICHKWHGWGESIPVFNRELCFALARSKHRVACLVLTSTEAEREEARKGNVELITCNEKPGTTVDDPLLFQYHLEELSFSPDLVVGHGKTTGPAACFYSEKLSCQRLHVIHDLPDECLKYDEVKDGKCNEEELVRSADFVGAIGTLLSEKWSTKVNRDVIEIIPGLPCLDTRNRILSPQNRYFVPAKYCSPWSSGLRIVVLAVNKSSEQDQQNQKPALMPRNTEPNGSTEPGKHILKECDKNVELNERFDSKQALIDLQGATLFLSPARSEAFGVSALDAIAIGIPIVISSCSGLAYTIQKHLKEEFHSCIKDVLSKCSGNINDDDEDCDVVVWRNEIDKAQSKRSEAFESAEELRTEWNRMFSWDKTAQTILDIITNSGVLPSHTAKQRHIPNIHKRISDSTLKVVKELKLFDKRQKFMLFLLSTDIACPESVHLGLVHWAAVFDFDRNSATTGYLKKCENFLENTGKPACRMLPPDEHDDAKKMHVNLPNGIPWILMQGLPSMPSNADSHLDWISEILNQVKKIHQSAFTLLIIWQSSKQNKRHQYKKLSELLTVFKISPFWKNAVKIQFVSSVSDKDDGRLKDIAEEWDAKIKSVDFSEFFRAIHSIAIDNPLFDVNNDFSLPSLDEASTRSRKALLPSMRWVDSVLELLYTTIGDTPEFGKDDAYHFYRGGKISWYGIEMNHVVERESWEEIKKVIESELVYSGASTLTLFHHRGTGGTTSARKILYDFHLRYPCVCLKTVDYQTFLAIKIVWEFTRLPILILADIQDGTRSDSNDIETLYSNLSNDKISCLILSVAHRQRNERHKKNKQEGQKEFQVLATTLTAEEKEVFYKVYSSQSQGKKADLDDLRRSDDEQLQIPFYYGLVAFDDEFKGLEPFVKSSLANLNDAQKKAMCFLGMSLYYGQKEVPLSALAGVFSLKTHQLRSIDEYLPPNAMELLIEDGYGCWRPRHYTIGREIIRQLLTLPYGISKDNWKLHLTDKTMEFIKFMEEDLITAILLNRISDENTFKQFSSLVEDIPEIEDVIKVFHEAMRLHPNNPYFKVHLGRFYSVKLGIEGYEEALKCTDEGILLASGLSKYVRSQFAQMKGIVYKRQIKSKIDRKVNIDELIPLAENGVTTFGRAISIYSEKLEDCCIPQVRMMCDIFRYIDRTHEGGIFHYLKSSQAHPFILSSITDTSDILEAVPNSIYYPQLRRNLFGLGGGKQSQKKEDLIAHFKELKKTHKTSTASMNRQIVLIELELCSERGIPVSRVAEELNKLLEEALKFDDKIDLTMRLWIRVAPHIPIPLMYAESKVAAWCNKGKSVRAYLYRYIFACIRILEGSDQEYEDERQKAFSNLLEAVHGESRDNLRRADRPVVFLGNGKGMGQLVSPSRGWK